MKKLRLEQDEMTNDVESSDPLSELDKQESLLKDINTKNKHIKSLLKDLEALQNKQIINSKTIVQLENDLKEEKAALRQYQNDIKELKYERNELVEKLQKCQLEMKRVQSENEQLQEERSDKQNELKIFISKLIQRAEQWKRTIDEKNQEIKALYAKTDPSQRVSNIKLVNETVKEKEEAQKTKENNKETTNYIEVFLTKVSFIDNKKKNTDLNFNKYF